MYLHLVFNSRISGTTREGRYLSVEVELVVPDVDGGGGGGRPYAQPRLDRSLSVKKRDVINNFDQSELSITKYLYYVTIYY